MEDSIEFSLRSSVNAGILHDFATPLSLGFSRLPWLHSFNGSRQQPFIHWLYYNERLIQFAAKGADQWICCSLQNAVSTSECASILAMPILNALGKVGENVPKTIKILNIFERR